MNHPTPQSENNDTSPATRVERARWPMMALVSAILLASGSACKGTARTLALAEHPSRSELEVRSPKRSGDAPLPLVVVLHGFRANPTLQSLYFRFSDFIDEKRFHLVHLSGSRNRDGDRFWNASPACCDLHGSAVDDVAYVRDAIARIRSEYRISSVFVIGHSNGGFMAFRALCELGDVIDGIVSLAGEDSGAVCPKTDSAHTRVILVHGSADETISTEGGSFRGLPRYPSDAETIALWRERLGCSEGVESKRVYPEFFVGLQTSETEYRCRAANRLERIRIEGAGHHPFLTDAFRRTLLDRLLRP